MSSTSRDSDAILRHAMTSPSDRTDPILYHVADGVSYVSINRPDRHNALSSSAIDDLVLTVERAVNDQTAVIVISGVGSHFCAGIDRSEKLVAAETYEEELKTSLTRVQGLASLESTTKPTIAVIRGYCVSVGFSIATLCDIRLSDCTVRLLPAFAQAGLSGDGGITKSLCDLVGPKRAAQILLVDREIDARRAHELGLIDIVPIDDLATYSSDLARQLAIRKPGINRSIKDNIRDAGHSEISDFYKLEMERHVRLKYRKREPA